MRTTITLDDDVAAEVERRRAQGKGPSETINELVRLGLLRSQGERVPFVQRTVALGLQVDVTNIGDVLELLDGE